MASKMVEITEEDIEFLRKAREHYKLFADAAERNSDPQTAGIMRKQEFYAERFWLRTQAESESP